MKVQNESDYKAKLNFQIAMSLIQMKTSVMMICELMNRVLNRRFAGESLAQCYVFSSGSGERSSPSP